MKDDLTDKIVLYRTQDGRMTLDVNLREGTVWLSLNQLTSLFDRDKSVISRHIRKIFETGELERKSVVAFFATTASDGKTYQVEYFNLDMIISVGYRVNSKRGTQFRIWATNVLRDHILKGYSVNEKRLKEENRRLKELQQTVDLLGRIVEERQLAGPEAEGLLRVVADYSLALRLLDDYDHGRLVISDTTGRAGFMITYEAARAAIDRLSQSPGIAGSSVFGREKDGSLKGSLGSIYQTFEGKDLYPSVEEKAAHLLYFVVKDHSFIDGNKRIAASLFLWFLDANGILYRSGGRKTHRRQRACCPDADDRGEQNGGKGCNDQGHCEPH